MAMDPSAMMGGAGAVPQVDPAMLAALSGRRRKRKAGRKGKSKRGRRRKG